MSRIAGLLSGNFRWMALLGVMIGVLGGYFLWQDHARARHIEAQGVEAVATIIQIRSQEDSKRRKTYWADLKWRDMSGAERQRTRIPVSGAFARRVLSEARLVVRTARIKYLTEAPDDSPLILDDGARNSYAVPAMMWLSLAFAAFSAFGWFHLLSWEGRAAAGSMLAANAAGRD